MRKYLPKLATAFLLIASGVSSVSCYYPVQGRGPVNTAYNQDSKSGYAEPQEYSPQPGPRFVGVDPGLAVAGVAAAGLLGYAIGNHHHHDYGPRYYGGGYGYYGRGYCR